MKNNTINSGVLIGGFTLLGMAAGWFFGDFKIGLFTGIGLGLVLSAFLTKKSNDYGK